MNTLFLAFIVVASTVSVLAPFHVEAVSLGDHGFLFTIQPCRVIDTRSFSAPALQAHQERRFTVRGNPTCAVPSEAFAIAANVTVVEPSTGGFLSLYPGNQTLSETSTSTINFPSNGPNLANGQIIPLASNPDGVDLTVYYGAEGPQGMVDMLLDVFGYFRRCGDVSSPTEPACGVGGLSTDPVEVATFGGVLFAVSPCRIIDTRSFSAPTLQAHQERSFTIRDRCAVHPDAFAIAANVTVVEPSTGGFLSLYPGDQPLSETSTSTINFPSNGPNLANGQIIPLSLRLGADLKVYYGAEGPQGTVDMLLDVVGYFQMCKFGQCDQGASVPSDPPPTETEWGVLFTNRPCRTIDTRSFSPPVLQAHQERSFAIRGNPGCQVPTSAFAIAANVTVVEPSTGGFLSLYPGNQALSETSTSTINFPSNGPNLANGQIIPLSSNLDGVDLTVYYGAEGPQGMVDMLLDVLGHFRRCVACTD